MQRLQALETQVGDVGVGEVELFQSRQPLENPRSESVTQLERKSIAMKASKAAAKARTRKAKERKRVRESER